MKSFLEPWQLSWQTAGTWVVCEYQQTVHAGIADTMGECPGPGLPGNLRHSAGLVSSPFSVSTSTSLLAMLCSRSNQLFASLRRSLGEKHVMGSPGSCLAVLTWPIP